LAKVPLGMKTAASLPSNAAIRRSELGHDAVAGIIVLGDAAGLGDLNEEARIGGGRQAEPVRAELHER
jgi:hypothetical protein